MAQKQESNPKQETQRFIADKYAEAVLIRDAKNGRVDAVSDLIEEKGKRRVVTVAPEAKNKPAFYQRKSSSFLANFIANYKLQKDNPYEAEFLIVPLSIVGETVGKLFKLQEDPKDSEGLKTLRDYRAYPNNLEKIKFDAVNIPWEDLAKMGISREQLYEDKTVNELMIGKESSKQYEINLPVGENATLSGEYAIKLHLDDKDNVKVTLLSQLAKPEFEHEKYKLLFSTDEKTSLAKGGTLNRLIKMEDDFCYVGFNKNTNRLIPIPAREVKIPDFLYGCRVNDTQAEELRMGGKVLLEKCRNYGSDNEFSCKVQYDVNQRDFVGQERNYKKPYIPEFIDKQLPKEEREKLLAGEEIDGTKIKNRDGVYYKNNLRMNLKTNNTEFVSTYRKTNNQAYQQNNQQSETQRSAGVKM